jgi:uracil-DNA glycosylase family 4
MSTPHDQLEGLLPKIQACRKKTRCYPLDGKVVPGIFVGEGENPVVLLGEAPGRNEAKEGVPMVGKAGKVLQELLKEINWTSGLFITNVVKCRPPDNRDPLDSEQECCSEWLFEQFRILQPEGIVCLGRSASRFLLKATGNNPELWTRGLQFTYNSTPILCTWHPAACLYSGGEYRKQQLKEDLALAKKVLSKEFPFL